MAILKHAFVFEILKRKAPERGAHAVVNLYKTVTEYVETQGEHSRDDV